MEPNSSYTQLRNLIAKHFSRTELEFLSYDLDIDFEEISGPDTPRSKVINNLLRTTAQNKQQPDLIAVLRNTRRAVAWPDTYIFPASFEQTNGSEILDEAKWEKVLETYLSRLEEQVKHVRVLGRRQAEPLENIFTHVNVLDKLTAERRYNIARLSEEDAPRDFDQPKGGERISGENAVAQYDKLFILGKPGAGKTTFLKHTTLRAIKGEIEKAPVFVTLKELSDAELDIIPFMVQELGVKRFANAEVFVEQWLTSGHAIVFFDGLDEVNQEGDNRKNITKALDRFVTQFSACGVLITCRVTATDYSLEQFQYVEMADFDDEQMEYFIDHWFAHDEAKRVDCKKSLLKDEETKAVRELAQVPLLLSLICVVFEETGEIPARRHELYEEATDALLVEWDASRLIARDPIYEGLSFDHKKGLLAHIAFKTFEKGDYFLPEKEVISLIEAYLKLILGLEKTDGKKILQAMEAQHGIFVERARRIHSFSHLTLQEYFAAQYIVDNEKRGMVTQLMTHVGDDRWREVFKLTAGMLDNATEFFKQFLSAVMGKVADDPQLRALLQWAVQQSIMQSQVAYKPPAVRAFLLYLASDLALDLASDLALDLVSARTRAQAIDLNLDLAPAQARALDLAQARALDLARVLDLASVRIRASDHARARALDHASVRALIRDFHSASQVAIRLQLLDFIVALVQLPMPEKAEDEDAWQKFAQAFAVVLDMYRDDWDLTRKMQVTKADTALVTALSHEQIDTFAAYLEVNNLLVRCLQVAYVPDREAIENQILLPPA